MMPASDFSLFDGFLLLLAVGTAAIMLRPSLRDAPFWRATVTPLASIIGSGFLVVVPLLAGITGTLSVEAITAIVLLSFGLGSAIRFNILHDGRAIRVQISTAVAALERLSDLALALAYIVSITFYIRLMSGFLLSGFAVHSPFNADAVATLVLAFIGIYGWWHGLFGLERLEEYSVTIKLAIIASLLAGLIYFDAGSGYDLAELPPPSGDLGFKLRQLGGMLLIVQGFETSKYLAASYDAKLRARSMLVAQCLAGIIYIAFVALAMPLMGPLAQQSPSETAIIDLSRKITLILPLMLVVAAAMSQFSAAIADTIGAGGVIEIQTHKRLVARKCYPLITALAVALIWVTNIFEVVALASRAFAFYYMLQSVLAARLTLSAEKGRKRFGLTAFFALLALLMLAIVLFALPVEA